MSVRVFDYKTAYEDLKKELQALKAKSIDSDVLILDLEGAIRQFSECPTGGCTFCISQVKSYGRIAHRYLYGYDVNE